MSKQYIARKLDGILLLNKSKDLTSNKILQQVKHLYQAKKAGHTGALDPLATGMLPICFGEATKFSQFLLNADKTYMVEAKLGERTNTSDAEGNIVSSKPINVDLSQIKNIVASFVGNIMQVPTMFSALKYQGKPLYEYARKGIEIERPARPITIKYIKFLDYQKPFLKLEVACSKGTYIRTLIDDIGEKLGCGAHVTVLHRIEVAGFSNYKMYNLEHLQNLSQDELDQLLLPTDQALVGIHSFKLNQEQSTKILYGIRLELMDNLENQEFIKIYDFQNKFIGIGQVKDNILIPKRLINH